MASVNKVILVGNLGQDPDARYLPSGDAVTNISVATTETWKDKSSGDRMEHTEWHRVTLFRRLGEIAAQYLKKGSQVYIEGQLRTRKWKDKDGNDRYTTEIHADEMKMLGGPRRESSGGDSAPSYGQPSGGYGVGSGGDGGAKPAARKPSFDDMDDDIPF